MPTRLPAVHTRRTEPARRTRMPLATTLAMAAALLLSLPACSHRPDAAGPVAPLPAGWTAPLPNGPSPNGREPPWGVPDFEPPGARHCSGPQRLREQPGRPLQRQHGVVPGAPLHDLARRAESAAKSGAGVGEASADAVERSDSRVTARPAQAAQRPRNLAAQVSAGMVDDNAAFADYLAFRNRTGHLNPRDRDHGERYRIELRDGRGRAVADAEVAVAWPGAAESLRFARTDGAGQVWLHPRALLAPEMLAQRQTLEVQVRSRSGEVQRATLQRGQKAALQVQLRQRVDTPRRVPLDLVFLIDATGSMSDEIHKLRDSLRTIADRVGALPSRPDLCWGLVAYRDHGDAFLTRTHDLTDDLDAFQQTLVRLRAGGGGDTPEALNEALDEAVHRIDWRGAGTSRLVVLVADAPPHFDRGGPHHDEAAAAALARGIKLHAVGASGLDGRGEAVFRQLAQSTGGRFVFLTYRDARRPGSGPGSETVHDVRDYSVDTLDELIVQLVSDELAPRAQP